MGKVGFSPIIGLAVVVALALAAVFGAMSLTPSPAHAQAAIEATIYAGEEERIDISSRISQGV